MRSLQEELEEIRRNGLERSLCEVESDQGTSLMLQEKTLLNFSSNNYLSLANDPRLKKAAIEATQNYGTGSGASRLVTGSMKLHHELEAKMARFKEAPAALIFNSGYQANLGIITTLLREGDEVYSDELNHASIVDACRLSQASRHIYRHNDMNHLEELLQKNIGTGGARQGAPHQPAAKQSEARTAGGCQSDRTRSIRRLIVADSVFSMDGDLAPLKDLAALAEKYGAWLMLDEAHATGVFGPHGKGLVEEVWPQKRPSYLEEYLIQMGTFGKALGSFGAYVAGSADLIKLLINKARAFIYTTALPPGVVAASLKALEIVEKEPERRRKLWENVKIFKGPGGICSPIIPWIVGDSQKAMQRSQKLFEKGFWVTAIRYPTVARGTERLRITLMASHQPEEIKSLREALNELR